MPWIEPPVSRSLALGALVLIAGCTPDASAGPLSLQPVYTIEGFMGPESVRYDPDQDVFFVSNIQGHGSIKDGAGYISRIDADDLRTVEVFIESGKNGVRLDAPKGMALQGDTLWVADIQTLRGFDRRTGTPVASLDLSGHDAVLLNDIAVGPDGSLRVTDTGIIMSNMGVIYQAGSKIFSIGSNRTISLMAQGPALAHPNGITWDAQGKRWIVVTFHPFDSEVYALQPGDTTRTVLARGLGRFDGVELLEDGRMLVTSWSDSSLHVIHEGRDQKAIRNIWQPADLGVDTRRGRVAIPLVLQGRVAFWEVR